MSAGGKDMRDAVAHRARADHSYFLNRHRECSAETRKSNTDVLGSLGIVFAWARMPARPCGDICFLVAETSRPSQCFFFYDAAQSKMDATMEVLMTSKLKMAVMAAAFLVGS